MIGKYITVGLLAFILLGGGMFLFEYYVGYPVYLDNCEVITNSLDINVATDEIAGCIKVKNHPFVNYWMEFLAKEMFLFVMIAFAISATWIMNE